MGRVFAVAVTIALLGTGPSIAQMVVVGGPATPGAGTTSSLGTLNPMLPVGGAGIPLASTELFPAGLSPAPSGPIECPVLTGSAVVPFSPSPASPSNLFDAGGTTSPDINAGLMRHCRGGLPGAVRAVVRARIGRRHVLGCDFPWRRIHSDRSHRSQWCRAQRADWGAGAESFDHRMSGARRDRHRDRARTGIGQPDRR